MVAELVADCVEHICYGKLKVPLWFPAPLLASAAVVKVVWPATRDLILDWVNIVVHSKLWDMLADFSSDNLWREAHRSYVEAVAVNELCRVSLHQLNNRAQSIWHIYHIHIDIVWYGACVLAVADSLVEYLYSVVCRTTTWQGLVRDNAREAE